MNDTGQPIIGRSRSILEQLLRIMQTRLELLSVEVQREKATLMRQLRLAAILFICGWLAGLTLVLWVALVLEPDQRAIFLGVLFAVLVIGAVVAALALRRSKRREPLFARVIHQLQLDRASLMNEHSLGQER